ncbi:MAG TPA: hypothetical protein VGP72_20845 [Planctomycetota bacterium]|jgi:hypothetical protein
MNEQPTLTDEDWALIVELLQLEQQELPTEYHHAEKWELREQLERKRQHVDSLLQRLAHPAPTE